MCLIPKDFILGHSLHLSAFGGDFSAKKCEQLACTHTTSRTRLAYSAPGSLAPPGTLHKDFWEGAMAGGPIVPGLGIVGRNLI